METELLNQKEPEKGVKRYCTYKSIKKENGVFSISASTNDKDRDGEIINATAYKNLDFYLKNNPVILGFHDYHNFSIGKAVKGSIENNALNLDIVFADTERGREANYLYSNGFMNSFSVGFIPNDWTMDKDNNRVYTDVELLEVSAVPVPSNKWALVRREANKVGIKIKYFASEEESTPPEKSDEAEIKKQDEKIKKLNKLKRKYLWIK